MQDPILVHTVAIGNPMNSQKSVCWRIRVTLPLNNYVTIYESILLLRALRAVYKSMDLLTVLMTS